MRNLIFLSLIVCLFLSCSKNESDLTQVEFEIPPLKTLSKNQQKAFFAEKATEDVPPPYAPEDLSGFDCVLVNVVGEGIGNWNANSGKVGVGRNFSYLGTYSSMVSAETGGIITVKIKKGTLRYIQLIGVRSNVGCPSTVTSSDLNSFEKFPGLFIIGSVEKNIFQSETINITPSYSIEETADFRIDENEQVPEVVDTTSPTPGNSGSLSVTAVGDDSATLTWSAASDEGTISRFLSYKIVKADTSEEVDSVSEVENISAASILMDWTLNKTTKTVSSIDRTKAQYFSVIVKDALENKAIYSIAELEAACKCSAGEYAEGDICVPADIGTWASSCQLNTCSNKPDHSSYNSTGQSSANCSWVCDDGYVPNSDFTACESNVGYIALGCAGNEIMTGLIGRTGSVLDKLGARCRTYNGSNVNGAYKTGTQFGGNGGSEFISDCGETGAVAEIEYANTIFFEMPVIGRIRFKCRDVVTGELEASWRGPFGESGGDYQSMSCSDGKYFSWISMGSSGPYTGDLNGLRGCR